MSFSTTYKIYFFDTSLMLIRPQLFTDVVTVKDWDSIILRISRRDHRAAESQGSKMTVIFSGYSYVEEPITYTYNVTNIGSVDILKNISVTDNKIG